MTAMRDCRRGKPLALQSHRGRGRFEEASTVAATDKKAKSSIEDPSFPNVSAPACVEPVPVDEFIPSIIQQVDQDFPEFDIDFLLEPDLEEVLMLLDRNEEVGLDTSVLKSSASSELLGGGVDPVDEEMKQKLNTTLVVDNTKAVYAEVDSKAGASSNGVNTRLVQLESTVDWLVQENESLKSIVRELSNTVRIMTESQDAWAAGTTLGEGATVRNMVDI